MAPASGFSYGAISSSARLLHIAGLTGHRADGTIDEDIGEQYSRACLSVAKVIQEAGGEPDDLVSMTIFTPVIEECRSHLKEIWGALPRGVRQALPADGFVWDQRVV